MVIELTGVVEDGSPADPNFPTDPRVPLTLVLGAYMELHVAVVSRTGATVDLTDYASATLTLRRRPAPLSEEVLLEKTFTPDAESEYVLFTIAPRDTIPLQELAEGGGVVSYDVWLSNADSTVREPVIPASPVYFTPTLAAIPPPEIPT